MGKNGIQIRWDKRIGPVLSLTYKGKTAGLCFCHRNPERTIWCFGLERFFCSRCLGILFGGLLGIALDIMGFVPHFLPSVILCCPLIIDGFTQAGGFRESNNWLRLFSGFLFGIGLNGLVDLI